MTPAQQAKVSLGQQQLAFTLRLVRCCLKRQVIFWVEKPDGSWFWKQLGDLSWDDILSTGSVGDLRLDRCMFGTAWRKRTKFRTNGHLRNQKLICNRQHRHVILRGRCGERGVNFTKLAEAYPRSLCSALSYAVGIDVGFANNKRKLDIGACAKCGVFRIGEAKNPGPRRPTRAPRASTLDDVELLEPQTIAIRKKFWDQFLRWLDNKLGNGALEQCLSAPVLLIKSLELYGHEAFVSGLPLHYYRQLLAHVQREYPLAKPFMSVAWAVVSKWEIAEPIQHRAPMPEPLLQSMVALSIVWKWPLFAAASLLCFHGICRIGEVLRARRQDLLTPTDLLSDDPVIFLRIGAPKSRRRGPNVQYATVNDPEVVSFLMATWQGFDRGMLLYPSSAASYRRRWDTLLTVIGVQRFHRLTPGSLRGGGCVAAHKRGVPVSDLLWKMRLQHAKTLGYYLQEITAESILPALSDECRANIQATRAFLPFLLKAPAQRTA